MHLYFICYCHVVMHIRCINKSTPYVNVKQAMMLILTTGTSLYDMNPNLVRSYSRFILPTKLFKTSFISLNELCLIFEESKAMYTSDFILQTV